MGTFVRRNLIYTWLTAISVILAVIGWGRAAAEREVTSFAEIDVQRINVREPDGTYVVPGSFEVSRLRELFADTMDESRVAEDTQPRDEALAVEGNGANAIRVPLYFPQHYEATTLGGLVSEIAGHIPHRGEVVEENGLRLEVLESTDRKVERVRVGIAERSPDKPQPVT